MAPASSPLPRLASGLALSALALAAACAPVPPGSGSSGYTGYSGVSAEFNRLKGRNGFAVVASAPTRTVFAAKGREVVIAPASGFCVASDSLDVSGAAAFALLADCGSSSNLSASPQGFPGIFTVSVSGGPMIEPGSNSVAALDGLESFVSGQAGRALLGRGTGSAAVEVLATRRVGDGLYVLVEDRSGVPLPVLGPRFWRAFVELGGRMSMVTASSFRESPVGEDALLAFLVRQVVALRQANGAAPAGDELQMAGTVDRRYTEASAAPKLAQADPQGSGDGLPDAAEETPVVGQATSTLADEPYRPPIDWAAQR